MTSQIVNLPKKWSDNIYKRNHIRKMRKIGPEGLKSQLPYKSGNNGQWQRYDLTHAHQ